MNIRLTYNRITKDYRKTQKTNTFKMTLRFRKAVEPFMSKAGKLGKTYLATGGGGGTGFSGRFGYTVPDLNKLLALVGGVGFLGGTCGAAGLKGFCSSTDFSSDYLKIFNMLTINTI